MTGTIGKHGDPSYMPTLDGLRGVACLMVFFHHFYEVLTGTRAEYAVSFAGVSIFFALSGFLMGRLYFDQPFSSFTAGRYVVSRISRIVPAYYIAIVFCWILYLLIPGFSYEMTPENLIRAFVFLGSEGVFWSIPPEIQFYGFFLFLWFSWAQWVEGKKIWLPVVAAISILFIATRFYWGGIFLPATFHFFLFGFLASRISKYVTARIWLQAVLVTAAIAYFFLSDVWLGQYEDLLFAALIAACVAALSRESLLTVPLKSAPMRLVGKASFSIYLFHDPLMHVIKPLTGGNDLLCAALFMLMALGGPILFHLLVERRLNTQTREKGMTGMARFIQR